MDGTRCLRAWVLGGDGRYPWAVKALRRSGLPVRTWGVMDMKNDAEHLREALEGADLVLLPMWPFQEEQLQVGGERVAAALLPYMLEKGALLIAGSFPTELEAWLQSRGVRCESYLELESYRMANAAVTAEGAVWLCMGAMERTLAGAEILVIGWGRIGRFLAEKLRALGARVTVTARREGQWQEMESLGLRSDETGQYHHGLGEYDAVLNTVPHPVLTAEQGEALKPDCVLVELASKPGGFAPELLERRPVLLAPGLPGRTAPRSAGANLAAAVWACLTGEGRSLE